MGVGMWVVGRPRIVTHGRVVGRPSSAQRPVVVERSVGSHQTRSWWLGSETHNGGGGRTKIYFLKLAIKINKITIVTDTKKITH